MDKAFYLKVNRNEGYTLRNLRQWLAIVKSYGDSVAYYVVCDNTLLKERILNEFSGQYPEIKGAILGSIKNAESSYIVSNVTNKRWEMAGYAHITTFLHARDNDYKSFWNIDADDTRFCLDIERCKELLDAAEEYAKENKIDCFSLDMHASLIGSGKHWSFGITYTNNRVNWLQLMKEICKENLDNEDRCPNFDRFFRYFRNNHKGVRIENFYGENLKFFHYSNDFFWRISESALFHWKDGYLTLPLLYYGVGLKNRKSRMPIESIVIKLDIGITDEESTISMLKACSTPSLYLEKGTF